MSASSESSSPPTSVPIKLRYRFGMAPDRTITSDPSLMETVGAMNKVDGAVLLGTTLVPAIYGYRIQKSFNNFYFRFGLAAGLFAGSIYAYCRSYARLTGISIPTPSANE